jgi:hypothetical protein
MKTSIALALMVLGCGAKQAEPLELPAPRVRPAEQPPYVLEGVRPELEITLDLQSYGRWPAY